MIENVCAVVDQGIDRSDIIVIYSQAYRSFTI